MENNNTIYHKIFRTVKKVTPRPLAAFIRSGVTAFYTPVYFTFINGHFKSSFKNMSVTRQGDFLPWYTYPCIDFLRTRIFSDKTILEFGGGQSTLWWAAHSKKVVTIEDDKVWYEGLNKRIPVNVHLTHVPAESREKTVVEVNKLLTGLGDQSYDIVVIDGLCREQMIEIAYRVVSPNGAIICDNAEGYEFYERFKEKGMQRIDFFGHAPGVMLPHCTSVYFKEKCFLLDPHLPIPERM